jgi:hypothetical protein
MRWPRFRQVKEDELDEEILAHLALEARQRVEEGETPEEAEHSARRKFGNVTLVKEVTRSMWRCQGFRNRNEDCPLVETEIRFSETASGTILPTESHRNDAT